jgi:iron complex outermembrane receptor protein
MDPASFDGIIHGGVPFVRVAQRYGTLELSYDVTPSLSLISATGYYRMRSRSLINTPNATPAGPTLAFSNSFHRNDFAEELRLNSEFAAPVNFTLGAFYQDSNFLDGVASQGNKACGFGPFGTDNQTRVDIKAYSLFGQVRWEIVPKLELAGGARWTDETRRQAPFNVLANQPIPVAIDKIHSSNIAPEFTLTYTPIDDLTLFAAARKTSKSGSFSVGSAPAPNSDNSFGEEWAKGGEVGLKSRLRPAIAVQHCRLLLSLYRTAGGRHRAFDR